MEVDEIQSQVCKFPRIGNGNGRIDSTKILGRKERYPDDEEDGEQQNQNQQQQLKRANNNTVVGLSDGANRLRGWHHSSRIIRVSRASGGKDRHSKVWTSKGLRDRRVRLSVTTAIQFYDLQDRLGYDQPSKAVEWLIKAAADAISELPSLDTSFPDTPKQLSDEKRASEGTDQQGFDSIELDGDPNYQQNQSQHLSLTKSACSSNSETSKGSGLSLSRSEIRVNRVKARERARERAAKEKEKENESSHMNAHQQHHQNHANHPISQSSSFTELLTGSIGNVNNNNSPSGDSSQHQNHNGEPNFFHKAAATTSRQWSATPMDYFNTELLGPSSSSSRVPHHFQLGNSNSLPQTMSIPPLFSLSNENSHHQEMQHFSFVNPDHLIPVATTQQPGGGGGDYNLNFTISSGLAGFNRGTLQSNSSPSLLPHHLQRFGSSPLDGSNLPFFIGTTTTPPVAVENHHHHHHHQFPAGFDGRLQLYYGDGSRHSDPKGKGKN